MRQFFALAFLFTLSQFFSIGARAQGTSAGLAPQQYTILGISVEGNKIGSSETIISQSGLRKGEKFSIPGDVIRNAIQQLWNQEVYSDVQIIADRLSPQSDSTIGVFLSIHVTELPHLGKLTIVGNKDVKTADIEKAIGIKQYETVRPWEIERAKVRVQALYEKEGHHFAAVNPVVVPATDSSQSNVVFNIVEGSEVTIRHIDFTGNAHVSESDLRGAMDDTHEKRWYKLFTSGSFNDKKYADDLKKLVALYRSRGFRDASVTGDSIWLTNKEDLNILIHLYEGPQYYLRNIAISGAEVFSVDEVKLHLGFQKGDIYNIERFDQNMRGPSPDYNDVGSLYYDRGYVVNITKEETVVPGDSVDVVLHIVEGKQHFFRYVDIQGDTKTKDFVIRRELFTRPGDVFSRAAIIRSIRQLAQLNYFNQEKLGAPDVRMLPDKTDVDLTYNLEERSSDTFNASVGYGGVLGFTGSVGVSFNNFDLSDPLHGGGGQIMSLTAEFGTSASFRTLSLSFTEPWLFELPTSLGFTIYNSRQNYIYESDRTGASLSIGRRFRFPDDFFRGDWTLAGQHANIINGGGLYDLGIHNEVSIQQVISRTSTDNPVFPTTGSEFAFQTRLAYLPIASIHPNEPSNYYKNHFTMKFYTPMWSIGGQNKLVLTTSADVGQLGGVGNTPYVPPTELFVMGGSGLASGIYSVPLRGYTDASIGIENQVTASGFPRGGYAYAHYVAELRFIVALEPIPVYFLMFGEAGNVWQDLSHADFFGLKRSLGLGARIQVPAVGLVGLDFGYGFDPTGHFGDPSGWHTHFQFGRNF